MRLTYLPRLVILKILDYIVSLNNKYYWNRTFYELGIWENEMIMVMDKYVLNVGDDIFLFSKKDQLRDEWEAIKAKKEFLLNRDMPTGKNVKLDYELSPWIIRGNKILSCESCMENHFEFCKKLEVTHNPYCFKNCYGLHEKDEIKQCCSNLLNYVIEGKKKSKEMKIDPMVKVNEFTLFECDLPQILFSNEEGSCNFRLRRKIQNILNSEFNTFIGKIVLKKIDSDYYEIKTFIPRRFILSQRYDYDIAGCKNNDYGTWMAMLDDYLEALAHTTYGGRQNSGLRDFFDDIWIM